MKELVEAISVLAAEAAPVANTFIVWYYIYWTLSALLVSATILGAIWLVCRTVRYAIDN